MTIARKLLKEGDTAQALEQAVNFCNHPTLEKSINTYDDGSMLLISSNNGIERVIYRSTLPIWAKNS
jgi:hypothetical protein